MSHLIDVFLHLDMYLDTVIQQYGVWMYFILFVVVFLETGIVVTPFLPGDSLLFAAGALCARGDLAVGWLFMLLCFAAVLGDTVNYSIGHLIGPRAFHGQNRFFKREHLDRTHQFYERHGGKTIVLARFIPIHPDGDLPLPRDGPQDVECFRPVPTRFLRENGNRGRVRCVR